MDGPLIRIPFTTTVSYEGSNLLADYDMEALNMSSWVVQASSAAAKQAGGHGGAQCLRLTYNGSALSAVANVNLCPSGYVSRVTGWGRGMADNSYPIIYQSFPGGPLLWSGTDSNAWQSASCYIPALAAPNAAIFAANMMSPGRYVEWDDVSQVPVDTYMRNEGRLGGTMSMGDGGTLATFPTLLGNGKRGVSFDGGDFMTYRTVVPSLTASPAMFVKRSTTGTGYLLDARTSGGTGWILNTNGTLTTSSGALYVDGVASTTLPFGQPCVVSCVGMTLASPASLLFGVSYLAANYFAGTMYDFELHTGTLTPTQLRALGERYRATMNLY